MNYWTTVIFKWNNVGHTMRSQSDTIGQWFSKLSLIAPRGWRLEHQWVGNQKNKVCSRTTREQVSTDDRLVPGTVRGRTTLVLQYDNGYLSLDFHSVLSTTAGAPRAMTVTTTGSAAASTTTQLLLYYFMCCPNSVSSHTNVLFLVFILTHLNFSACLHHIKIHPFIHSHLTLWKELLQFNQVNLHFIFCFCQVAWLSC